MRKWFGIFCRAWYLFFSVHAHCRIAVRHKEKNPLIQRIRYLKAKARIACGKKLRVRFVIRGEENLVQGQKLYIGNHTTIFDPVAFVATNRDDVTVVSKKEVENYPFFKTFARFIDCPFLDRSDLRSEIKIFRQIDNMLGEHPELSVLIFPEGTRSKEKDFPLLPFHAGTFKVATRRDLPICPFVMYSGERVLDRHFHFKVYPVQITYLKPLMPEEYQSMTNQEIADLLYSRMNEALKELREREASLIAQFNGYTMGKTKKLMAYKPNMKTF